MKDKKIEQFEELLGKMSYFNAAEGMYGKETRKRKAVRKLLFGLSLELRDLGVTRKKLRKISKGYLVSEADYINFS